MSETGNPEPSPNREIKATQKHLNKLPNSEHDSITLPLTVNFIFLEHAVFNEEGVIQRETFLKEELTKLLKKGTQNIILLEGAEEDTDQKRNLLEGFEKYNSLRKAYIYALAKKNGYQMDENGIDSIKDMLEEDLLGGIKDPIASYRWLEAKVIDSLIDEYYQISIAVEKGMPNLSPNKVSSLEEFKERLQTKRNEGEQREEMVARQIEQISEDQKSQGTKANLVAIFGKNHYRLPELLNEGLSDNTHSYIEPTSITPFVEEVIVHSLIEGKTVTDQMFEDAYYKKVHTGKPNQKPPTLLQRATSFFKKK